MFSVNISQVIKEGCVSHTKRAWCNRMFSCLTCLIEFTLFSLLVSKRFYFVRKTTPYIDVSCSHRLLSLNTCFSFVLQIIKKLIERKQAQIRKVYPGLSCFKDGVRQIPIESIPGISMYRSSFKSKIFW